MEGVPEGSWESLDDLAKIRLKQLCFGRGQSIDALFGQVARPTWLSKEQRELLRDRLEWNILFCDDFEYPSDQGEVDQGSFLHLACRHGLRLVREVLERIARAQTVEAETKLAWTRKSRRFLRTPLHEAVSQLHAPSVVQCLLDSDMCVHSLGEQDIHGMTPFHQAVITDRGRMHRETRMILLERLLRYADKHGQLHVVHKTDKQGRTAMDVAIEAGHITEYAKEILSLPYPSAWSAAATTNAIDAIQTGDKTVFDLQKLAVMRTLPRAASQLKPDKPLGAMLWDRLNQAFEVSADAPRQRDELQSASEHCPLLTEDVLAFMLELCKRLYLDGTVLRSSSSRIASALQTAANQDSIQVIHSIYALTAPPNIKSIDAVTSRNAFLACCRKGFLHTMELMCSKDPSIAEKLDATSLKLALQKAVLASHVSLTSVLCAHTASDELCALDIPVFDAVLNFSLAKDTLFFVLHKIGVAGGFRKASPPMKGRLLRKAAEHGDIELSVSCIKAGALHRVKKWAPPSPVDLARNRGHDRLARMLQRALEDENLLSLGDRPVDSILLLVGCPPGAGKSTLVQSLKTSRLGGKFRKESQPDEGVQNYLARTKGIRVYKYTDEEGTPYHVLDLGGHDDFAAAHQLFIGQGKIPIINAIVISSLWERAEMQKEVMKWCAFYASRYQPEWAEGQSSHGPFPEQLQQPVIVIATRLGEADGEQRRNVIDSFGQSKYRYGDFLKFQDGPVFVDARKSWAHATRSLRENLAMVKGGLFQRGIREPAMCADVQKALPRIRKTVRGPLIHRHELSRHVAGGLSSWKRAFDESVIASREKVLGAVLRKMSDAAEIISFQKPELVSFLVIQPEWLLSHIVGILMSPEHFRPPHVVYHHGRTKRSLAEAAVSNPHLPGNETLKMVAQLGLCILEDEDMIVPSKLDTERDALIWTAEDDLDMYFGIRFSCKSVPLSPALFPQLQVHLYNKFLDLCGQVSTLWKDGMHVTLHNSDAEGLLEAQRDQMAINVAVRGSSKLARDAYQLLQLLKEQVLFVAEEFSPGSDMSVKILSSKELTVLAEKGSVEAPTAFYNKEDVQDALERVPRLIRPRDGCGKPEDPLFLMVLPPTHVLLMSAKNRLRFCEAVNGDKQQGGEKEWCRWPDLAKYFNMQAASKQLAATSTNPTGDLLRAWSLESAHNTVERLLDIVKAMPHQAAAAVLIDELREAKTFTIEGCAGNASKPGTTGQMHMEASVKSDDEISTQPSLPVSLGSRIAEEVDADIGVHDDLAGSARAADSSKMESRATSKSPALAISTEVMLKVAEQFEDVSDCEELAVYLDLKQESGFVTSLLSANPHLTPKELAFRVMRRWVREKGSAATGAKLDAVLRNNLTMVSVAEKFASDLVE